MSAPFRLDGRRALVTGGASGIGEATCRALTGAGAAVIIVDVDRARAESLAAELPGASVLIFDIADEAAVNTALEPIGALDIPFLHRYTDGFIKGAQHVKADITISPTLWVGGNNPFSDPARGQERAAAMVADNVDRVLAAASGSNGGIYFHTEYQDTGWPAKGFATVGHLSWSPTLGGRKPVPLQIPSLS